MNISSNTHILGGNALRAVDQQNRDLTPVNTLQGFEHTKLFKFLPGLAAPPNARGVDEKIFLIIQGETDVDGIPGGTRHIAHQNPFRPQDAV